MKIHNKPKLFEYDDSEGIVDIFIKEDPQCPYPFSNGEWYHQGFYMNEFIIYLNDFFSRYKLPYNIKGD